MSSFPKKGEADVVQAEGRYFLLVDIPEESAMVIADGIARGDFTRADLADGIESAARMKTMPARIKRAM